MSGAGALAALGFKPVARRRFHAGRWNMNIE